MQFTPDTRNVGGRQIIISQLWGHRLCLQQIKDRQFNLDLRNQFDKKNENQKIPYIHDFHMEIHKKKLQTIKECLTDRNKKEPSYFFRRLPSPTNISSLQNKLNNTEHLMIFYLYYIYIRLSNQIYYIKSKSTQEKMFYTKLLPPPNIELNKFIPQSTRTKVDWDACIKSLQGPQYPIKKWIRQLAIQNRIFDETDFAILIRILVQAYQIKQTTLINIVSELIEEFEK